MGKSIGLLLQTSPYLVMRTVAYLLFGLFNLVWLGIVIALFTLLANAGGAIAFVVLVVGIGGFAGIVRLAERLVFYAIKAGHVAVLTELLTKGSLPPGVNQVEFGKDIVVRHFGTMAAFGVVDALVEGAVRQVLGWLTPGANFLSFIPGVETVWKLVRAVLSVAGNYIDEAVLSYTLAQASPNVWQSAADGVVLYAQAWKKLIVTALAVVLVIGAVWLIGAVPFFLLGTAAAAAIPGIAGEGVEWIAGVILGVIGGGLVRAILADPIAMVMMVTAYHEAVREMTPEADLYGKLSGASRKFRELQDKAQQPAPAAVPVPAIAR